MTGSAKQSIYRLDEAKAGLLRRFRLRSLSYGGQVAPRNDEFDPIDSRWGKFVGSPKSCLVAGEDDGKASQLIFRISEISLANRPKSVH